MGTSINVVWARKRKMVDFLRNKTPNINDFFSSVATLPVLYLTVRRWCSSLSRHLRWKGNVGSEKEKFPSGFISPTYAYYMRSFPSLRTRPIQIGSTHPFTTNGLQKKPKTIKQRLFSRNDLMHFLTITQNIFWELLRKSTLPWFHASYPISRHRFDVPVQGKVILLFSIEIEEEIYTRNKRHERLVRILAHFLQQLNGGQGKAEVKLISNVIPDLPNHLLPEIATVVQGGGSFLRA